jgi:hypothetical protein
MLSVAAFAEFEPLERPDERDSDGIRKRGWRVPIDRGFDRCVSRLVVGKVRDPALEYAVVRSRGAPRWPVRGRAHAVGSVIGSGR